MHGTCVDLKGSGILIIGRSGSGKSSLAVDLLALGASLVADDQCNLIIKNDGIRISKPASLPNSIEMRGIGLVSVPMIMQTNLDWVVNWTKLRQSACQIGNLRTLEVIVFPQFLVKIWMI